MNAKSIINANEEASDLLVSIEKVTQGAEIYHSIKTLCLKLSISRSTVDRWRKEGNFPLPVNIYGQDRYRDSDIETLVRRQNPRLLANTQVAKDAAAIIKNL